MAVVLDAAAYQRAAATFGELIVELSDEEWELPTHPDDWTVVTTVAWVVVGDAMLASGARGDSVINAGEFDAAVLGPNPVASWRGTAVAAIQALDGADLDALVDHPEGSLRLGDLVAQRVSENLLRAHDLGVATGRPVDLPEDLAEACLNFWADHAEHILAGGVLPDTPIEPDSSAGVAQRFLALMGRPSSP